MAATVPALTARSLVVHQRISTARKSFTLVSVGPVTSESPIASKNRLLTTLAWQLGGKRTYALEGSIFVAGAAVKWLRDGLGLLSSAEETAALARSVPDNGGVYVVPALSGLGAPHWSPEARGLIDGLSFASGKAHVARAALEAMAKVYADNTARYRAIAKAINLQPQ